MAPIVTNIKFIKVKPHGSFRGFVHFVYNNELAIKNVAVHEKLDKTGYRLAYHEEAKLIDPNGDERQTKAYVYPINKETQKIIDAEITGYIKAQLSGG